MGSSLFAISAFFCLVCDTWFLRTWVELSRLAASNLGFLVIWVVGLTYSSLGAHAVDEENLEFQAEWMQWLRYLVSGTEADNKRHCR